MRYAYQDDSTKICLLGYCLGIKAPSTSIQQYFLSTYFYHVPNTVLGARDPAVNKINEVCTPWSLQSYINKHNILYSLHALQVSRIG